MPTGVLVRSYRIQRRLSTASLATHTEIWLAPGQLLHAGGGDALTADTAVWPDGW
jgi:hypothetical protein